MNVLSLLLENAGELVTADELLDRFWPGKNTEPSMVSRCINQIRGALGDDYGWIKERTVNPGNPATSLAVSPAGKTVVFVARNDAAMSSLMVRHLDRLATVELVGTEGAEKPFFSPDSAQCPPTRLV